MILVIVYVGAVAVLFLFVVMMLDIDFSELRAGVQRYAPIGAVIGAILFLELLLVVGGWRISPAAPALLLTPAVPGLTNTDAIGRVLYTQYAFLFETASLVLFVAMIGAIVLTHRDRKSARSTRTRAPKRLQLGRDLRNECHAGFIGGGLFQDPDDDRHAIYLPQTLNYCIRVVYL